MPVSGTSGIKAKPSRGRSGQYARDVIEGWRVTLVVDGDAGYQASFGKRPGG